MAFGARFWVFISVAVASLAAVRSAQSESPVTTATGPATTSAIAPAMVSYSDPAIPRLDDGTTAYLGTLNFPLTVSAGTQDRCSLVFASSTARLVRLLAQLESTTQPIRLAGITIITPKPGVDELRVTVQLRLHAAENDPRPQVMPCLRDVTQAFPSQANSIWATSFSCDDSCTHWNMDCSYQDERYALKLMDNLRADPHFLKLSRSTLSALDRASILRLQFDYVADTPESSPASAPASSPASTSPNSL
jgi:hypothetical protein